MVAIYIGFHLLGTLQFGAWGHKLTLGEELFILLLAPAFLSRCAIFPQSGMTRAAGEAAIDALESLTHHTMPVVGEGGSAEVARCAPSVTLRDVGFRYSGGPVVLEGFSLDIAAGEHIALLAPSGYGKSTLLALIAGLAAPQAGEITIGDTLLEPRTAVALRKRMSWVGQKPHIFAGSARHNITLGRYADRAAIAGIIDDTALSHVAGVAGNRLDWRKWRRHVWRRSLAARTGADRRRSLRPILFLPMNQPHISIMKRRKKLRKIWCGSPQGKTLIVATHDETLARRMHRIVRLDHRGDDAAVIQRRAAE